MHQNYQQFELPWHPSGNHRLGMKGKHFYRTKQYANYISQVQLSKIRQDLKAYPPNSKLGIRITCYPPSLAKRDLDQKCLCDALQEVGLINDDFEFWHLEMDRKDVIKGGKVVVEIWELAL